MEQELSSLPIDTYGYMYMVMHHASPAPTVPPTEPKGALH